ncbi:Rpn family recombination-promoting nuclease/putative transposase [uncultured Thiodictyon sp.]|jgi:predicted transposase/invertase (TIGR01784 family)|uniref:Rpn family recombination-promoting nuclease/putative transposase n=1 Tax=uncultured Thiodictyon sp. TaxID=1846217 RepID=UPI0025CEF02F|nr:Rpn family recombination-promoting nuclease/putative transposase [uncultured Thiodictyon sp.]
MRHAIDPKIDCVFKALLGTEANRALLIHFLNAILGPALPRPITWVEILNPYNEREFLTDKLSIVDVKARDDQGRLYQVEIQLLTYQDLPARILYTWNDIYNKQLQSGQDYRLLKPTYAIWLLGEDLLPDDPRYTHRYRLRDDQGLGFIDHGGIYLLELNKFTADQVETEEQRWLKFFKDGEHLDADRPPDWMQTAEMRQAMSTLKAFSEKEHAYDRYRTRQDFLREQSCIQGRLREAETALEEQSAALEAGRQALEAGRQALEAERQAKEAERQAKETERQAKEAALQANEAALAEIDRLKALLQGQAHPTDS